LPVTYNQSMELVKRLIFISAGRFLDPIHDAVASFSLDSKTRISYGEE